ncbi:hypothetical protein FO488_15800 [Geobacter sp. FeAm09]|uniref:hemerythrin domain-containing protein n=1 Tax=Geobacter sp. FeAm09 TaxID=2597769 RepID=UPI0011EFF73D|nr:hemerythrin domain-containing protein [Geobacter sp. FeAm09]QEM69474.1 hypothetical protein FO488_15800 [Geobacter sp. FeAm09]
MESFDYRQRKQPFSDIHVATKHLAVRASTCDSRYKNIIDPLDALFSQLLRQPEKDLRADFDLLLDAVLEHVGSENASMAAVDFPQAMQHGRSHQSVCAKTAELRHRFREGRQVSAAELSAIRQLWLEHIETHDRVLADFLAT